MVQLVLDRAGRGCLAVGTAGRELRAVSSDAEHIVWVGTHQRYRAAGLDGGDSSNGPAAKQVIEQSPVSVGAGQVIHVAQDKAVWAVEGGTSVLGPGIILIADGRATTTRNKDNISRGSSLPA
jgi:hypothetical protein